MFKWCLVYVFVFIVHYETTVTRSENSYGEFNLGVTNLVTCKGPKQKDCSIVSARMYNASNLLYDLQIIQNVLPDKGKITAMANGKILARFQMKNPCYHLFIGQLFQGMFNITNCTFKKGNYSFNINLEDLAQKYYGGMFLYGNLTFKSIFYNDECNLSCTVVEVEIYPKNKTSH